ERHAPTLLPPGPAALTRRALTLSALAAGTAARLAAAWVAAWFTGPPTTRRDRFGAAAATVAQRQVQRAGATFIKGAQLLSTRLDLLSPSMCRALSRLQDDVAMIPPGRVPGLLADRLGLPPAEVFDELDPVPIASGSIACVYRAVLADGTTVAVKLRRPGLQALVTADLRLLRLGTAVLARTPLLRGLPAREAVDQLGTAIVAQLDFTREASALTTVASALAGFEAVRVPLPHPELGGPDQTGAGILIMDFMAGLSRRRPEDLGRAASEQAVETSLNAVYKMLFLDGLVHCDLHPGNLYFDTDGTVCLLDAGFIVELSPQAHRAFTEFFFRMGTGNERRCADLVLSTATAPAGFDESAFRADIGALVRSVTGVHADAFNLLDFSTRLFALQRTHGLFADPQFIFPLLGLLVLEGAIKDFHPFADFQTLAVPYLMNAIFTAS
ncbi:MAG: AarF/UbiB family protein, partial [Streptosporangiaceae bacterium]